MKDILGCLEDVPTDIWVVAVLLFNLLVMLQGSTLTHGPINSDLQIGSVTWFGLIARDQDAANACSVVRRIARNLRDLELSFPGAVPKRVFELNEQFCQDNNNHCLVRYQGRYGFDPWEDCYIVDGIKGVVRCKFDNPRTKSLKLPYEKDLTVGFRPSFRYLKAELEGRDRINLYLSKSVQKESVEQIKVAVLGRKRKRPKVTKSAVLPTENGCRIELQLAEKLDDDFVGCVFVATKLTSTDGETIPRKVYIDFE